MKKLLLVALSVLAFLAGCHQSPTPTGSDGLVGIYGADPKNDGNVVPMLKVERNGDAYVLYEFSKGEWRQPKKAWTGDAGQPQEVRPFLKADLEKLVRHPVDVEPEGLQTKGIALIHVPAGWSDGGRNKPFTTKSGYFAMTLLGPIDLQRM
ncbi:hypothetical protein [Paraburkholderia susongensis]|uniref:Uncharacterized protein n=1 Tax=Paraburkholderia susongensis TaxID=1515439 RepID=A0A1X7M638_9BURK|nr:hypothetical protein [Paraburkholderia susongensis]SMG61565.1 hypothetical protein SAMN06265784_12329 [Paraburkholderia susongensis]